MNLVRGEGEGGGGSCFSVFQTFITGFWLRADEGFVHLEAEQIAEAPETDLLGSVLDVILPASGSV